MTGAESIVLEYLPRICGAVEGLRDDMREVKGRLGILESQHANVSSRMDCLDSRIDRIERRLELTEA